MKPKTSELNPKRLWKVIDLTIQTVYKGRGLKSHEDISKH